MFAALGDGEAVQPPQTLTLFPRDAGDFITYLGVLAKHEVFGAKLSPYIAQPGAPIVTAWTARAFGQPAEPEAEKAPAETAGAPAETPAGH